MGYINFRKMLNVYIIGDSGNDRYIGRDVWYNCSYL